MSETNFAHKVDRYLRSVPNLWYMNVFGNAVQRAGIPDRLICYCGKFIAIELKRETGSGVVSPRQKIEIAKIQNAGGVAYVADSLQQVIDIVEQMKEKE